MRFRLLRLGAVALGFVCFQPSWAQGATSLPPAWPRAGATLLIENERGAVYDVTYAKGRPSALHQHRYAFAGLDLATSAIRVSEEDGTAQIFPVIRGNMWFLPKGTPHTEVSIIEPVRHLVAIDIKDRSLPEASNDTGLPANQFAGFQRKAVDNDRVVIWDCAWAPGVRGTPSFDSRDMFVAFAEGGELSIEENGRAVARYYASGQAIFLPGGKARTFSSVAGTVHAMIVQLK